MGKLKEKDASCRDDDDNKYPYGMYKDIENSGKCVRKCVRGPGLGVLDSLVGVDYNCEEKKCYCLYEGDALENRNDNKDDWDKVDEDEDGDGKVKKTKDKDDFICIKLDEVKTAKTFFSGDVEESGTLRQYS